MILARYLLSQFLPPFLFSLFLFSGVLLLDKIFDLVDLLVNKGVSLFISLKMLLLFLPTVMSLSVPMSVLLSCLLTFGRLSEDNEIIALRASGLSFSQIIWPPLAIALLLSSVLLPFNATLTPRAMTAFRGLYHSIVTSDPLIKIEPRQFIALQNIRLYAREVGKDHKSLQGVWLYQYFPDRAQRIYAERGKALLDGQGLSLQLKQGQIERFVTDNPQDFFHIQFKDFTLSVPFAAASALRDKSWRELSLGQLRREIRRRKEARLAAGEVEAEFHLRFAVAFAPLALSFLGIPLGIALERGGRGVGFGAAVGVLFLYYLILILGLSLAEKGVLPAFPALWTANVLMAAAGAVLYRRRLQQ